MEISDIQIVKKKGREMVEVTFQDGDGEDIQTIIISVSDAWYIARFCQNKLSLKAQGKSSKGTRREQFSKFSHP